MRRRSDGFSDNVRLVPTFAGNVLGQNRGGNRVVGLPVLPGEVQPHGTPQQIKDHGSRVAAERRAIVFADAALGAHAIPGCRAFHVEPSAIELLHERLIRDHAAWRTGRIADYAHRSIADHVGRCDDNEGQNEPVGTPFYADERDVVRAGIWLNVEHFLDLENASSVGCRVVVFMCVAQRGIDRLAADTSAECKLATVPLRDQRCNMTIRYHNVGVNEPPCTDVTDARNVRDVDAADQRQPGHDAIACVIELLN